MKLRRWVKDVMLGLAVFAIGTAAILTAGVIANSIEAKQSAVMVSKDVNSNLDCNQTLSLSTDATGSDTSGNGIVTLNDITTGKKIHLSTTQDLMYTILACAGRLLMT